MRRKLFLWIGLVLPSLLAAQNSPQVELRLDHSQAYVGQSVQLNLQVDGTDQVDTGNLTAPAGIALRYVGGGPRNAVSTYSINGRTSTTTEKHYLAQWTVKASQPGEYSLGPFTFTVAGQRWTSPVLTLSIRAAQKVDGFRLIETLTPSRSFPGTPLVYKLKWLFSESVRAPDLTLPILSSPDFKLDEGSLTPPANADVVTIKSASGRELIAVKTAEVLDGKQYVSLEFTLRVVPLHVGKFRLAPAVISFEGATRYQLTEDFFGRQVREPVYSPLSIPASGLEVEIGDLPSAGKPAAFSGLIGRVSLKTEAEGRQFRVGDPVPFTLSLTGAQNLKDIDLDRLVRTAFDPNLWKVGEETRLSEGKSRWTLRPVSPQAAGIPELRLNYFDPEAGRYAETVAPAIPLNITGGAMITSVDPATSAGSPAVVPLEGLGLRTSPDSPVWSQTPVWPWLWLAVLPGPLVFAGLSLRRRHLDSPKQLARQAVRLLKEKLSILKELPERAALPEYLQQFDSLKQLPHLPPPFLPALEKVQKQGQWKYYSGQPLTAGTDWSEILQPLQDLVEAHS